MATIVAIQPGMIWQPNRVGVAAASIFAAAVVLAMMIFMFDRQLEPVVRVTPVEIRLNPISPHQTTGLHVQPEYRIKPRAELKTLHIMQAAIIPLQLIEPISPPIDWQQQIEMSVRNQGQTNTNPAQLLSNKPPPVSPLQQALNAPRKPETMQNGDSYRSIYGGVMLKSGGMCSELQTIQVGPSPSNRVTIAFPGYHCAGDYQPSMAEELSNWADKEAQKHPPRF